MSGWQVNDLALSLEGEWYDADGFPLITFPTSGPRQGQVLTVAGIASVDVDGVDRLGLVFEEWAGDVFDASCFRRIPPLSEEERRKALAEIEQDRLAADRLKAEDTARHQAHP